MSIPLIFLLGKLLVSKNVGLISAVLLAISPFHIYYSQELRPYSLFLFLTICAYILFLLAIRDNNLNYFWLLIITITLGVYTHTYMVFVLALLDIVFLLQWKKYRHFLNRWLLVHISISILCIPEIYILMHHILLGNTHLQIHITPFDTFQEQFTYLHLDVFSLLIFPISYLLSSRGLFMVLDCSFFYFILQKIEKNCE